MDAVVGTGAVGQQQQQQQPQPAITPQQVAQEAIAKTMAAMQQQLPPGHVFDNRRGYLHGNLIGEVRGV